MRQQMLRIADRRALCGVAFNRQLRKVTKNKAVFPNDDALLKMLYLAQSDITRKWTGRRRDWGRNTFPA